MNSYSKLSYLDAVKRNRSTDEFKLFFYGLGINQKQKAISYLNEDRLYFSSLFILMPEIEKLSIYENLNQRNVIAIKICAQILKDERAYTRVNPLVTENSSMVYSVLKWMLKTGAPEDGLSNEYDGILDTTASILIKTYKDSSILPLVAEMIFKRNRKGALVHDLVWCFFQAHTPYCLTLIAGYLRSSNPQDVELARTLLHFVPDESGEGANLQKQYQNFLKWLRENKEYLYFTDENLQFTSTPKHCRVDLDAKYLCKSVLSYDHSLQQPLTDDDKNRLQQFHALRRADKKILSKYSHRMHERNSRFWSVWMQYPVEKQLEIAKAGLGGLQ